MRKAFLGLAIAIVAWGPARLASADAAADRAAAQQIAQNMKQSGELKDYRVGVKYQNGVAWLMGSVTSAQQKAAAERIARETDGVERVISKLEVAGGDQSQAAQLAGQVQPAASEMPQAAPPRSLRQAARRTGNMPVPFARTMQGDVQQANYGEYCPPDGMAGGAPLAMGHVPSAVGASVAYDNPQMPGYAWPSYAAYPNYAALTYPQQYSPSAWPYIGPFYPYPQVPLGWRKVTLEWDDGWWFLDFKDCKDCH
ncbi:MAG: BON domain-containing protein [Pirellulales bacterium]|nr:BON domain-containing protein [Pirellulales bacterium]